MWTEDLELKEFDVFRVDCGICGHLGLLFSSHWIVDTLKNTGTNNSYFTVFVLSE